MLEPNSPIHDASHDQDLAQSSSSSNIEAVPIDDQGQLSGQDGDSNDQEILPRSNEDIEARRKARVARTMEIREHTLDKGIGDLRGKVSTRRQLANFSDHQAHISMVEQKKVFEADVGAARSSQIRGGEKG